MATGYQIIRLEDQHKGKYISLVCHTLQTGSYKGPQGVLFPGNISLRIKNKRFLEENICVLTIKGVARNMIRPGAFIFCGEGEVCEHRQAIFFNSGQPLSRAEYPMTGGVDSLVNSDGFFGKLQAWQNERLVFIQFQKPYPLLVGMDLNIGHGQMQISLPLIYPGTVHKDVFRKIQSEIQRTGATELSEIRRCFVHVMGYVPIPPHSDYHLGQDNLIKLGSWLLMPDFLKKMKKKLLKAASKPGGFQLKGVDMDGIASELCSAVVDILRQEGQLKRNGDWFLKNGPALLSPFHKSWLTKLDQAGYQGINTQHIPVTADREALDVLERSDLLIRAGHNCFHTDVFARMTALLFSRAVDGQLDISVTRDILGTNRNTALEILNVLEKTGRLKMSSDGRKRTFVK